MAEKDAVLEGLAGKIGRTAAKEGRVYFEVTDEDLRDVARHLFVTPMVCRVDVVARDGAVTAASVLALIFRQQGCNSA